MPGWYFKVGSTTTGVAAWRLRNAGERARKKAPGNPSRRRIDQALKCERKLRAKMVNAYDAGRRKPLRRLINIYITSYNVRLAHVYRANLKRKKHLRLPLRDLAHKAHEVDLLRPCAEPVKTFRVPKEGGGTREITAPGMLNMARSMILASVLKLARDRIPGNAYYTGNGGRSAAIKVVEELVANPDNKWLVENDIADFFGSFDEANIIVMLREVLPLDPRAVAYTALASHMNYPSESKRGKQGGRTNFLRARKRPHTTRTRRQTGIVPYPNGCSVSSGIRSIKEIPTAGKDRCGLPQGFPASPIIAELLVAPSLAGRGVIYADNIMNTFATLAEVRENDKALMAVLADHRAGPFKLKPHTIRRLDWGADVLGIHIKKRQGSLTTGPTERALKKFLKETWTDPATTRRTGKKINVPKLKKRAASMARAMPLEDEAKYWLELLAEDRLDYLVKIPHQRVDPRSLLLRNQDELDTWCEIRA